MLLFYTAAIDINAFFPLVHKRRNTGLEEHLSSDGSTLVPLQQQSGPCGTVTRINTV